MTRYETRAVHSVSTMISLFPRRTAMEADLRRVVAFRQSDHFTHKKILDTRVSRGETTLMTESTRAVSRIGSFLLVVTTLATAACSDSNTSPIEVSNASNYAVTVDDPRFKQAFQFAASPQQDSAAKKAGPQPAAINLQDYIPPNFTKTVKYAKWTGDLSQVYRFFPGTTDFYSLYGSVQSRNTPGSLLIWEKRSNNPAAGASLPLGNCINTYGMLWMGTDKSISEVGDWMPQIGQCTPSIAFGYRDHYTNLNGGLSWSGSGGLSTDGVTDVVWPKSQSRPGSAMQENGWVAYNHTKLLSVLPTFTPDYGRNAAGQWVKGAGKTYRNVAQILFLHGVRDTRDPSFANVSCPVDPGSPYSKWYFPVSGFKSYASLYNLAPQEGIIQMTFLFNETDNYWPKSFQCKGYAFSKATATETSADAWSYAPNWVEQIDER